PVPSLISSLFPYTTLFRSDRPGHRRRENLRCAIPRYLTGVARCHRRCAVVRWIAGGRWVSRGRLTDGLYAVSAANFDGRNDGNQDRKSTRLNSSHVSISYA